MLLNHRTAWCCRRRRRCCRHKSTPASPARSFSVDQRLQLIVRLSCCSTPANCTSCLGELYCTDGRADSGFQLRVSSSGRSEIIRIPVRRVEAVVVLSALVVPGADTTVVACCIDDMVSSSDLCPPAAAMSMRHTCVRELRGEGVFFNDQAMCGGLIRCRCLDRHETGRAG